MMMTMMMQEVDAGGGFRGWMQEVDAKDGCRRRMQGVDAVGGRRGVDTGCVQVDPPQAGCELGGPSAGKSPPRRPEAFSGRSRGPPEI